MSDSIFVNDQVQANILPPKQEQESTIPIGMLTVKLSSDGKLSAPRELHFRDYTYDDAVKLGMSTDDNIVQNLVKTLNECVYEDFDCANLHEKEFEEVLLNMFFNFWGSSMEKAFPLEDEDLDYLNENNPIRYSAILEGKETPKVELKVSQINTAMIPQSFKEPIIIKDPKTDKAYRFIMPRLKHLIQAKDFIDNKYYREEQMYKKLESDIEYNNRIIEKGLTTKPKDIDADLFNAYRMYIEKKGADFLKIRQAMVINGINDQRGSQLEDCLEMYSKVPLHIWRVYNKTITANDFGVVPEIEVISPVTNKTVTRRFLFQFLDFLPTDELQHSDGYVVSFGN